MSRVRTEVELDEAVLRETEAAAARTGRDRDEVIEDVLRRELAGRRLDEVIARVRARSDLTGEQALALAYQERDALRAERHEHQRRERQRGATRGNTTRARDADGTAG